jgi:hypothetical protein
MTRAAPILSMSSRDEQDNNKVVIGGDNTLSP